MVMRKEGVLVSVRILKILQVPLPSSLEGEHKGPKSSPYTSALSHQSPKVPQALPPVHFTWASPSASQWPPPAPPPQDIPGQILLFLSPLSALPVPLSQHPFHPRNSKQHLTLLSISRLKVPPGPLGTGSHARPFVNRGGSQAKVAKLKPSASHLALSHLQALHVRPYCLECWPMFTSNDQCVQGRLPCLSYSLL